MGGRVREIQAVPRVQESAWQNDGPGGVRKRILMLLHGLYFADFDGDVIIRKLFKSITKIF